MTRKLLISLLVIAFMSLMVGQGVVSFLADIETATGNTFTAGTIDLQVDDQDHPPALIELPDLKPCTESMDVEIPYSNVGTNAGSVKLKVYYDESDDEELDNDPNFEFSAYNDEDYEVSADDFAKKVYISKAEAHLDGGIVDLMPTLVLYAEHVYPAVGSTIDGHVSVFEFAWQEDPYYPGYNIPRVWPLTEVLQPGAGETLVMRFHLDGMAGNDYQADGIVSTLDFEMMQLRHDPSLVMDLQMDEGEGTTAYDSTHYNNDGTIVDNEGDQWTSGPPYVGYALDFDGVDDHVQVPDSSTLDITNAISIEAWVYWEDGGDYEFITAKAQEQYEMLAISEGGREEIDWIPTPGVYMASGPHGFPTNQWNHLVCTYTSGVGGAIYVNGAMVAGMPHASSLTASTADFFIGRRADGSYAFDGIVDRVRVYSRALNPEEIFYSYLVSYSHYHGGGS